MSDWKDICAVDDIPLQGARRVQRAQGPEVAVFRTQAGEVYALPDQCPHKGGPLSQGLVFGRHVSCPLHHWAIALDTGRAREPDVGCITPFTVRVQDRRVWLLHAELATLAVAPVSGTAAASGACAQAGERACAAATPG